MMCLFLVINAATQPTPLSGIRFIRYCQKSSKKISDNFLVQSEHVLLLIKHLVMYCCDTWFKFIRVQLTTFNISLVVHGTIAESNDFKKVNCLLFCYSNVFTIITFCIICFCISNYPSLSVIVLGFHIGRMQSICCSYQHGHLQSFRKYFRYNNYYNNQKDCF